MPEGTFRLWLKFTHLRSRLEAMADMVGLADPKVLALGKRVDKLAVELQRIGMVA